MHRGLRQAEAAQGRLRNEGGGGGRLPLLPPTSASSWEKRCTSEKEVGLVRTRSPTRSLSMVTTAPLSSSTVAAVGKQRSSSFATRSDVHWKGTGYGEKR